MLGLDVSNWQPTVDWPKVYGAGVRFAWLKASQGVHFRDGVYAAHRAGARAAGIVPGAYHFAEPGDSSPESEALFFLEAATPKRGELRPVLDIEKTSLSPADTVAWALAWLKAVEAAVGVKPVFYTYPYFWRDKLGSSRAFVGYPLWLASYRSPDEGQPFTASPLLPDWPVAAHQFTSNGSIAGIASRVDLNTAFDFPAISTEAPMTLPNWLETIDDLIHVRKWVYAFARWRLVDKADPTKRPADAPSSITQPVWRLVEGIHAICREFAEQVAAPLRQRVSELTSTLSWTEAALEAERTTVGMLREQLSVEQAVTAGLREELSRSQASIVKKDQQLQYALESARAIVTNLEEGGTE